MRPPPIVTFLALRTALLVIVAGILWLFGFRSFLLFALALLISSVLSLPLLTRRRDAVSKGISARVERTRLRLEEASKSEDE